MPSSFVNWGFAQDRAVYGDWPKDENGAPGEPAFLTRVSDLNGELKLLRSMLESFGIPNVCKAVSDGDFGTVIMGTAAFGTDVYVPAALLEDAKNILNNDNIETENEEE